MMVLSYITFYLFVASTIIILSLYFIDAAESVISMTLTNLPLKNGSAVIIGFHIVLFMKYYALNEMILNISFNMDRKYVNQVLDYCALIHLELNQSVELNAKLYAVAILGNMVLFFVTFLQYTLTFLKLNENRRQIYALLTIVNLVSILSLGVSSDVLRREVSLNRLG